MSNPFFDHPILNSPYVRPERHWEFDETGQPTQQTIEKRGPELAQLPAKQRYLLTARDPGMRV